MTWTRFKHWWINTFWYHYGKGAVICLCALALVIMMIRDMSNRIQPDFTYTVVADFHVNTERLQELTNFFTDVTPDINGDTLTLINASVITMTDHESLPHERFLLSFLTKDNFLYIVDEPNIVGLIAAEAMEDLTPFEEHGYEVREGIVIRIDHISMIRSIFYLREGEPMYIGIKKPPLDANEMDMLHFMASLNALQELLDFR